MPGELEEVSMSERPSAGAAALTRQGITRDEVTVVIPTLNEEEGIGKVLQGAKDAGFRNLLVVDGFSTDKTVAISKDMGAVVVTQHGRGKTGAMRTAFERVSTPYALVLDGDGTYDPKDALAMLEHARKFDMIIGSRSVGKENIPGLNRFGNRVITRVFNLLFGTSLSDVCSGMYLVRVGKTKTLDFISTSFSTEVELVGQMASQGEVTDVPITYSKRLGKQKLSAWRDGSRILADLFRMAWRYNPALLFSAIGSLFAIPAAGVLVWVFYEAVRQRVFHSGDALFGVMLMVVAAQAFAVTTISVMLRRMERRMERRLGQD